MGKLTSEEAQQLKALRQKAEAPDSPPVSRAVSVSVDLGDKAQVALAQKLGLLDRDEESSDGDKSKEEDEGDTTPKRGGYFK